MSYFEYVITGELTPIFEEKTNLVLSQINEGTVFYRIDKYVDEIITEDKKKRTLVLTAPINIWNIIYSLFKECNVITYGYFKQRIM